jgi:hypothetical protein
MSQAHQRTAIRGDDLIAPTRCPQQASPAGLETRRERGPTAVVKEADRVAHGVFELVRHAPQRHKVGDATRRVLGRVLDKVCQYAGLVRIARVALQSPGRVSPRLNRSSSSTLSLSRVAGGAALRSGGRATLLLRSCAVWARAASKASTCVVTREAEFHTARLHLDVAVADAVRSSTAFRCCRRFSAVISRHRPLPTGGG